LDWLFASPVVFFCVPPLVFFCASVLATFCCFPVLLGFFRASPLVVFS
jgi:hypothetical protein